MRGPLPDHDALDSMATPRTPFAGSAIDPHSFRREARLAIGIHVVTIRGAAAGQPLP